MLTIVETANELNVSKQTIYALVEAGKIAYHRIGVGRGTIRIAREDLKDYVDSCREDREEASGFKHLRL